MSKKLTTHQGQTPQVKGPRSALVLVLVLFVSGVDRAAESRAAHTVGSIAGRVSESGLGVRARVPAPYPSRSVGRSVPSVSPDVTASVIYLKISAASPVPAPRQAELKQRDEAFAPGLVAVTRGSTVGFPNDDPYFHNVFSLSAIAPFNLGRYPRGESRARRFDRAGMVRVFCDIHSHMSATIFVFDHPYFTVPAPNGQFRLDDVPPGSHTLVAWHSRHGEWERSLVVEAGQTTPADVSWLDR